MDFEELKQLVLKLAAIAERLDERSENAVTRVEHSSDALSRSATGLHTDSERFVRQALQAIEAQAGNMLERGVGQAVDRCNARLQGTTDAAATTARELDALRQALQRERRSWIWRGTAALLAGSILAIGASSYWSLKSQEEIERNQVEAALLRAYNQADVTLCEDGRLCANVEDDSRRHGDQRQYRMVRPRSRG